MNVLSIQVPCCKHACMSMCVWREGWVSPLTAADRGQLPADTHSLRPLHDKNLTAELHHRDHYTTYTAGAGVGVWGGMDNKAGE